MCEIKKKMGRNWGMPWSPKKEEQEVPDPDITCSSSVVSDNHCHHESNHMVDLHHPKKDYFSFMDDMELDDDNGDSLFGIPDHGGDDDIKSLQTVAAVDAAGQVAKTDLPAAGRTAYWDFDFTSSDHDGGLSVNEDSGDLKPLLSQQQEQESILRVKLQEENNDDDDDDYQEMNMASLNLSLNYQHVLDAWSDRGTLWAHDNTALSLSNNPNNNSYVYMLPLSLIDFFIFNSIHSSSINGYTSTIWLILFFDHLEFTDGRGPSDG